MLFLDAIELLIKNMETIGRSSATIKLYRRDLRRFAHHLACKQNGPVYLEDITAADLEEFLHNLKELGIAPNSRSRYLYTFRAFYKFAYKKELVDRDISQSIELIKIPAKERQYLSQEEVEELAKAIRQNIIRLAVLFLANTGLRISECLSLTLDDVDLDKSMIRVIQGKGGKDRNVPINQTLLPLLKDYRNNWRDAYGSDLFFATKKSGSLSNSYINTVIRNTVKKLGWKKQVSCHTLRHSFASSLVKKKVGLVEIQKLLGHSSLKVTSVYTHVDMDQLNEAVNAL